MLFRAPGEASFSLRFKICWSHVVAGQSIRARSMQDISQEPEPQGFRGDKRGGGWSQTFFTFPPSRARLTTPYIVLPLLAKPFCHINTS